MNSIRRKRYLRWLWTGLVAGALLYGIPALERTTAPFDPVPPGGMAFYVFDVGQGDALLAQAGTGQILVDGGPGNRILERLGAVMPPGDRTIELVVATHPDADHLGGLVGVLERYTVERILMTDVAKDTTLYRRWRAAVDSERATVVIAEEGARERVGEMTLTVRHAGTEATLAASRGPGSSDGVNDAGIVSVLSYGHTRFLLAADVTSAVEERLVAGGELGADLLKVGHHGSAYSTGESFLAAVAPRAAVISVGEGNTYGHPAWRVLQALRRAGAAVFRTDRHGTVRVTTDGHSLHVDTERVE